jgi:transcriptional regulator of arginine metabolism
MKKKVDRLNAIKIIVSSKEIGLQDELLNELTNEGFRLTQATLSRDLKQLKVAKAANTNGKYVYVLPNDIMYKRSTELNVDQMSMNTGFISLRFSGNMAVIRTRPGYASRMAYDIDNHNFNDILGTVAGDDTVIIILKERADKNRVFNLLALIIPNLQR